MDEGLLGGGLAAAVEVLLKEQCGGRTAGLKAGYGVPGKTARQSSRSLAQGPPLLTDFTKEMPLFFALKSKTLRGRRAPPAAEGCIADAFFGASPVVASALGIRSGATPCGCLTVTCMHAALG